MLSHPFQCHTDVRSMSYQAPGFIVFWSHELRGAHFVKEYYKSRLFLRVP